MPTHFENYPDRYVNRLTAILDRLKALTDMPHDLESNPDFKECENTIRKILMKTLSIQREIQELLITNHYDHRYVLEKLEQISHYSEHLSRVKQEREIINV